MKKSLIIILGILLLVPLASAGLFDWVTLSGQASTASQDLNISIGNTGPQITEITLQDLYYTAVENSSTVFSFNVYVYDHDGAGDLDSDVGLFANITKGGESEVLGGSCSRESDIDANTANFSCAVEMWYFYAYGNWSIGVNISDNSSIQAVNDTATFDWSLLTSFIGAPSPLTFTGVTIAPGDGNITSDNDAYELSNTGNDDIASGQILINSSDLVGETDPSRVMEATQFRVHTSTADNDGANNQDKVECGSGTAMVNVSYVGVVGASLASGNLTAGAAQEELYYCLFEAVSTLTKQAYSTEGTVPWVVKINSTA